MRRYLVEAAFELLRARLVVAWTLKRSLPALLEPTTGILDERTVRYVRYIVALAANAVPWSSVCLPNAVAARRMLARRGIGSTMHLGVGFHEGQALHAHAWLEADGIIVTGENGTGDVTRLPITEQDAMGPTKWGTR